MPLIRRKRSKRERVTNGATSRVVGLVALGAIAAVVAAKRRRRRPETPPAQPQAPVPPPAAAAPAPAAAAPPPAPAPPPPVALAPEAATEPAPDDATLARAVEEQIVKSGEAAEGEIDVTVRDGIAELPGDAQSTEQFRTVFDAAGEVDGVRGVQEPGQPPVERRPEPDDGDSAA